MAQPSIDLLKGVNLFADLDDKTLSNLASEFIERHFDAGTAIATEGVDGLNFFIVSSGEATVTVQGRKVGSLSRGDAFGEVALVDKSARSATVTADTPDGRVRAPGLELPPVRRATAGARVEAAGDARRAPPLRPGRARPDRPTRVDYPRGVAARRRARRTLPGRRRGRLGRARGALLAIRVRDRDEGVPVARARRRGRLPGGVRTGVRAARHAPLRRCDPAVDRAADPELLPRPPAQRQPGARSWTRWTTARPTT